jgi:alanine racemase
MTARVLIDLNSLRSNYALFRKHVSHRVGAVVKANAYGLGSHRVRQVLSREGCEDFFVATIGEGLELKAGISDPDRGKVNVYVFEGVPADKLAVAAEAGLIPILNTREQAERWQPTKQPAALHVDTGIVRLGLSPATDIRTFPALDVVLLMTHLANADRPQIAANSAQLQRFDQVRKMFPGVPTSIGNSAAILSGLADTEDLARPGIGLYGGNPFSERPNPMQPVATLQGSVLQIVDVPANTPIGYGGTYITPGAMRLATVGIGYADGLPRSLSNTGQAYLNGKRVPIVGRISMDLTVLDVSQIETCEGDWVEFYGANILLDELEARFDQFSYELLTRIGSRVERIYVE